MEDDEAFEKDQPSDENHYTISLRLLGKKPSVGALGTSTFYELQNIQSGILGSHDLTKNHPLYRFGRAHQSHQKPQIFEPSGQLGVNGSHSKGPQFQRRQSGRVVLPWIQTLKKLDLEKQIKLTKISTLASGFPEEVLCQRDLIILNHQNAI
jgi:hypothetical protein